MRIRLLLAIAAAAALAACSGSPTAPHMQAGARSNDDGTCRSGYHIATRIDGTTGCEADP
jgi:ABC-type glycerol-3-phosphate transport system substrate-binding protein